MQLYSYSFKYMIITDYDPKKHKRLKLFLATGWFKREVKIIRIHLHVISKQYTNIKKKTKK